MKLSVRVEGMAKGYGSRRVIEHLDLELGVGVTGLLGPNGAGKTTLLRCLATAATVDAGRLRILDHDPANRADLPGIRRRLGYLPQNPGLYAHFTAEQMLDYMAILKEMTDRTARRQEIDRVLTEVDLSDRARTKIRKLSGGMRQRLGIAQALIGDPPFIILDEPTVGLDPEQRMRFRALVSNLGERRIVLLSTHQTEDVATLCERVVVLCAGTVRFDGTPEGLAREAEGMVWLSAQRPASTEIFWRTSDGRYRVVGPRPEHAEDASPSIEDGYLRLLGNTVRSGA
ncbi:ATP-binding cassette domain-containing protein [Dactylosporangium sp. NPDC051484]|uniref:ATP-binding cassette domain-containing protein n=1 Tax=Dactylosporangium sp. NPDC051484 TaxID=3154942 RepID=UPI00344C2BF5